MVNDDLREGSPASPAPAARDLRFTRWIFVLVCLVIVLVAALLAVNLIFQYQNYQSGIAAAATDEPGVRHGATLSYARAWDFAVVKTSSLFLAYVLIFTGALYVLGVGEATFALRMKSPQAEASFRTSSPGLAMIALGVLLAALAIYSRTEIATTFERSADDLDHLPAATSPPAVPSGNTKAR